MISHKAARRELDTKVQHPKSSAIFLISLHNNSNNNALTTSSTIADKHGKVSSIQPAGEYTL
jgi:hypothetical protein